MVRSNDEVSALLREYADTYAGPLRRMRETVGDIDILAAAEESAPLMDGFAGLPVVAEVIARGTTKTSIRTGQGLQVDLRVVAPAAWGAALQYFTGSKPHNIRLREIAQRRGLKLPEYGLFDAESGELIVSRTEDEVYDRLGLPWIPPPLREDRGEIDAALAGELPELVTEQDIRGDLHSHTTLTDGVSTLEDMVDAAAGAATPTSRSPTTPRTCPCSGCPTRRCSPSVTRCGAWTNSSGGCGCCTAPS